MENRKTCTHIKISGVRCGSPSLRGEQFCYYHQRMHRGVRTPPQSRLHPIALIEDKESIQAALMEVMNGLLRNTIEFKRATLLLRALHIAVKNAGRAGLKPHASSMVKEVPEYDDPSGTRASTGLIDLEVPFEAAFGQDPRASKPQRSYKTPEAFAKDRDDTIANYYGFPTAEAHDAAKKAGWTPLSPTPNTHVEPPTRAASPLPPHGAADALVRPTTAHAGTPALARPTTADVRTPPPARPTAAHVPTPALGSPGGPAVPVRSALPATTPNSLRKAPMAVKEVPATMKQANAAKPVSASKSSA